jgi:nucleotide-binding universal stress UspA family protein
MNNLIIIPIDFSEQSMIALEQGCNLASVLHSDILLLHISDNPLLFLTQGARDAHEAEMKAVEERLKELAEKIRTDHSVQATYEIRSGKIYSEVTEVAAERDARFILMGTNGSVGLKKRVIGSNTLRVIKESTTPVISIKGKHHRRGCQTIVLPLDLTKETRQKVGKAIEFAEAFGSRICVVSVVDSKDEEEVTRLKRQMIQVQRYIETRNIPCTSDMIKSEGSIAHTVLSFAKSVEADLIMVMTQQEQDITDLFIGSSAQEIINHSEVPVVSIIPNPTSESVTDVIFR